MAAGRLAHASDLRAVGSRRAVDEPANEQPWLDNPQWAAREIRTEPVIRGGPLAAAYAVLGWIPVVLVMEALGTPQPFDEILQMLGIAVMSVFVLGWLSYSWLAYCRYGTSVCRLLTLPGVIGGRFEADIECGLSCGPGAPVIVRLKNRTLRGKIAQVHWQMETRVEAAAFRPHGDQRVVISIRLQIPRDAAQRPCVAEPIGFVPQWLLEISRESPGIDYRAEFDVPVFDAAGATPHEGREPAWPPRSEVSPARTVE